MSIEPSNRVKQLVALVKRLYRPGSKRLPLRDERLDQIAAGVECEFNPTRVSAMLDEVFQESLEGRRSPYRLTLTRSSDGVVLIEERNDAALDQFWAPHNDGG